MVSRLVKKREQLAGDMRKLLGANEVLNLGLGAWEKSVQLCFVYFLSVFVYFSVYIAKKSL